MTTMHLVNIRSTSPNSGHCLTACGRDSGRTLGQKHGVASTLMRTLVNCKRCLASMAKMSK